MNTKKMARTQKQKDYCMLGKEYSCPHQDYCARTNRFSIQVLGINPPTQEYFNPENREARKKITSNLAKKIKNSRRWPIKGSGEEYYACNHSLKEEETPGLTAFGGAE